MDRHIPHYLVVAGIIGIIVHCLGYVKMAQTVERWTVNREAPV